MVRVAFLINLTIFCTCTYLLMTATMCAMSMYINSVSTRV